MNRTNTRSLSGSQVQTHFKWLFILSSFKNKTKKKYNNKCLSFTHTHTPKNGYLVSLAHHRKPHVAAARQRCSHRRVQTGTQSLTHTNFYHGERLSSPTCTDKSQKNSQLHRLGVIHSAERLHLKSLLTAGSVG